MKRKIIISVTNDIAYDQRMQKTSRTLSHNGFDIYIVGRMKPNSTEFKSDYFSYHRFKMMFTSGKLFYLEYNIRLFFYLLAQKADIFCAVDLDSILPNVIIGRLKSIPIVYDAHEYFTEVPEVAHRPFVKFVWKSIERYSIPLCHSIYTVGNKIAELFTIEYKKNCEVIYNLPFKIESKNVFKKSEKIILYQGDLNEGRGLEIAIQGMKDIEAKLWIVGDGYTRKDLEKLVIDNNLEHKVKFYGYIAPNVLKLYTAQAFLGLNLLENRGLNHYYSLANKFFDCIQMGVPVVTMDFPEYSRINSEYHCAILLKELTITEFVGKVKDVILDENIYSELVKNCDIAARFLNWESQEEKLSSIYHNVV